MAAPLLYVTTPLKSYVSNFIFTLFPKSSNAQHLAIQSQLTPKSQISVQNDDLLLSVMYGNLYYYWDLPYPMNGTGQIGWSGTTLDPLNILMKNSFEGFDTNIIFNFNDQEWTYSLTYLGYGVPLPTS